MEGRRRETGMTTLTGRIAIVTGAGHGIGHATTLALARAGADVAVVDIDKAAAEKTAAEVSAAGRRSLALATDVGDLASIDQMVSRVVETFGGIDVLVNNAGVTRRAYIMDLTEADWDRIMRVNGKGVFFCLQRAVFLASPGARNITGQSFNVDGGIIFD